MAAINHTQIHSGIIQYIQSLPLGLSSLKDSVGDSIPAVIKSRQKIPRPPFPYIVVDFTESVPLDGSWLRDVYVDDDDVIHYVSEHTFIANITCYGEMATTILYTIQQYLLDDVQRATLRTLTGNNAVYQKMSNIGEKPLFIETDFIDGAEMDTYFTVISDTSNPDAVNTIISTVEVEGKYYSADDEAEVSTSIIVSDTDT